MDKKDSLNALAALAQETRLDVFRLLVKAGKSGMLSGEIGEVLGVRQNTMSANLSVLLNAGLVSNHREGRAIRYVAQIDRMAGLLDYLTQDCCGGRRDLCEPLFSRLSQPNAAKMPEKPYNVLFLCTGNSAPSILAEAILRREAPGKFIGYSAGAQPAGAPHPYTLDLLTSLNHDTSKLRSKSWDEFAPPDAPQMDFVFTVCDQAASEPCPVWPGQPMSAHWGVPDPVKFEGSDPEKRLAFADTYRMLQNRISIFVNLPMDTLDRFALQKNLEEIGQNTNMADVE